MMNTIADFFSAKATTREKEVHRRPFYRVMQNPRGDESEARPARPQEAERLCVEKREVERERERESTKGTYGKLRAQTWEAILYIG